MKDTNIVWLEENISCDIDVAFRELVDAGILHTESRFFFESKERAFRTCFQILSPLIEFNDFYSVNIHSNFSLHSTYLCVHSFFLDNLLDSMELDPVRKVKTAQASTYLLIKYYKELSMRYDSQIVNTFHRHYREQTKYLIHEKEWAYPQDYLSDYMRADKIYKKVNLLLFPACLCEEKLNNSNGAILKMLMINYFSIILLCDDIIDIESDLKSQCITYPIGLYYIIKGEWPQNATDLRFFWPQLKRLLNSYFDNINRIENDIGWTSIVIHSTISKLKEDLCNRGYEI